MTIAKIYKPSKTMQSGRAKSKSWILEFVENPCKPDPLMGWQSMGILRHK